MQQQKVLGMNAALKLIIETAMKYEDTAIHEALDEIYIKMIIRPLQLAWRSKNHDTDNCSCSSAETWGPK